MTGVAELAGAIHRTTTANLDDFRRRLYETGIIVLEEAHGAPVEETNEAGDRMFDLKITLRMAPLTTFLRVVADADA